jgi:hypothetical protein
VFAYLLPNAAQLSMDSALIPFVAECNKNRALPARNKQLHAT